jgi:RNA polymerase sigma-70 factor, ECF subfamily
VAGVLPEGQRNLAFGLYYAGYGVGWLIGSVATGLLYEQAAGNKLAMQALFARHRTSVYRWLLRFVSNETLAEDLLSEVFLDVWRQAARFECRSSVSTWLISITRHKALSARRRRTDAELDEKIEATVADPADDPEVALQEKIGTNCCAEH